VIVGGRAGPRAPFADVHAFNTFNNQWMPVVVRGDEPLIGRWRHQSIVVDDSTLLLLGGRTKVDDGIAASLDIVQILNVNVFFFVCVVRLARLILPMIDSFLSTTIKH
jgi:hypothetical protein